MSNPTVENVYTRQRAKELTKKHFWKMLGMMLIVLGITCALTFGGTYLLSLATGAQWQVAATTTSYSTSIDPATIGAGFIIGYLVLMVVITLLGSGLSLGLAEAMIALCRSNETVTVGRVFSRMRYSLKGWGLSSWVGFKTLLWALPPFVVIGFIGVGIAVAGATETTATLVAILPVLAMIISFVLIVPAMYRYMMSTYILADEPSTGVFECVRKSKVMMKGHKWQCFKLNIPFLLALYGWMFAIIIVMALLMAALGKAVEALAVLLPIVVYVVVIVLTMIYSIRSALAYCLFYLKRKDEQNSPAVEPAAAE